MAHQNTPLIYLTPYSHRISQELEDKESDGFELTQVETDDPNFREKVPAFYYTDFSASELSFEIFFKRKIPSITK